MPTFFANSFGLLGLLAIPAILIIHMLREKSRRLRVSTLFLLAPIPPRTPRGRALHFIQNSWPLWLQLLAALLCTWLLADPRWVRANSFQSVAVILDSSASMSACRARVLAELPGALRAQARLASETEWVIATSDAPGLALYRGRVLPDALAALERWQPLHPRHDPAPAFANALANAHGQGSSIVYISDEHPESLPAGVTLLAFGRPIENVGFAGVRTWSDDDGAHWEAIVKNSGATPQQRAWTFETESVRSRPEQLRLAPGQLETINGPFPKNERHLRVRLTPDEFPLDDELPLVAAEPKPLKIAIAASPEITALFDKVLKTLPGAARTGQASDADVVVSSAAANGQASIVLGGKAEADAPRGELIAEPHALMEGLVWDGLLSLGPGPYPPAPKDQTLLWQGERPLILVHTDGGAPQLVFNFDLATSNAARLPAFVLLVGRFLTTVRESKAAHFAENFETDQWLPITSKGATLVTGARKIRPFAGAPLRAPLESGFFSVQANGTEVVDAAGHFGDPRESDFRGAISTVLDDARAAAIRQLNSVPDPLASVWLVLIAAALIASWFAHGRSLSA